MMAESDTKCVANAVIKAVVRVWASDGETLGDDGKIRPHDTCPLGNPPPFFINSLLIPTNLLYLQKKIIEIERPTKSQISGET